MSITAEAFELKALQAFASTDETRLSMCVVWSYESDGGRTYVATDGHVLAMRRSGTHRNMLLADIAKLAPTNDRGADRPPAWQYVTRAESQGMLEGPRGMCPNNFALLAHVERAASKRAGQDFVPNAKYSKKQQRQTRIDHERKHACVSLIIPASPLDGWYWYLDAPQARWEGMLMPRRV